MIDLTTKINNLRFLLVENYCEKTNYLTNGSRTNGLLPKRDISNRNYRFTDQVKLKFSDISLLNRCSAVCDNPARNTLVIFSMLDQVFSDMSNKLRWSNYVN